MPKDSLTQKLKAFVTATQTPTDEDEETTSGLVFTRKRKVIVALIEHSHSNGRAPSHHVAPLEGQALPRDMTRRRSGELQREKHMGPEP